MMRSASRRACVAIGVLVASMISGCDDGFRGLQIAPTSELGVGQLLWAADGSEVYYTARLAALKAAKSDGSGTRVLDDTKTGYDALFMPPDGSSLYYAASETAAPKQRNSADL